jgi:hypothetical protein
VFRNVQEDGRISGMLRAFDRAAGSAGAASWARTFGHLIPRSGIWRTLSEAADTKIEAMKRILTPISLAIGMAGLALTSLQAQSSGSSSSGTGTGSSGSGTSGGPVKGHEEREEKQKDSAGKSSGSGAENKAEAAPTATPAPEPEN